MNTSTKAESPQSTRDASVAIEKTFTDVTRLNRAVNQLAQSGVPVDEIHVHVLDADGRPGREVSIENQSGALGGASSGAVLGAVVGLVILLLARSGLFGALNDAVFGLDTTVGGFRVVAVLALAGVPIGAVFGLRSWNAHKSVSVRRFRGRSLSLVVETDELADLVREILDEATAEPVASR